MNIILKGNPYSTNSIYFSNPKAKIGMRFMSNKARELKKTYTEQANNQWNSDPLDCELKTTITLYFGDKRKRDWDNYHKLSMDSLSGVVFVDDSQIRQAEVFLRYDRENPRTEIDIFKLNEDELGI